MNNNSTRSSRIGPIIAIATCTLLGIAALVTSGIMTKKSREIEQRSSTDQMLQHIVSGTVELAESSFSACETLSTTTADLFHSGLLDIGNWESITDSVSILFRSAVANEVPIRSVTFGESHGGVIHLQRNAPLREIYTYATPGRKDGVVRRIDETAESETQETPAESYDARVQNWYFAALDRKHPGWGVAEPDFFANEYRYYIARPLYDRRNTMIGVLKIDLDTKSLCLGLPVSEDPYDAIVVVRDHSERIVFGTDQTALPKAPDAPGDVATISIHQNDQMILPGSDVLWSIEATLIKNGTTEGLSPVIPFGVAILALLASAAIAMLSIRREP